jgi:hypothetical protein
MNGNGNGDVNEVEVFDDESELRSQAIALTDRTLTAIGGLELEDPAQAAEVVAQMYLRLLRVVREEE